MIRIRNVFYQNLKIRPTILFILSYKKIIFIVYHLNRNGYQWKLFANDERCYTGYQSFLFNLDVLNIFVLF